MALTIEEITADFFDASALKAQPITLYRVDGGDSRWYYEPDKDHYYPSVTSKIQAVVPMAYGLFQWCVSLGPDYVKIRDRKAAYGTWFHLAVQEILIAGTFDFDALADNLFVYSRTSGYPGAYDEWLRLARQDILSFITFVRRHKVKPLAVEVILASDKNNHAGAVDLVCDMIIPLKGFHGEVYAGNSRTPGGPKIGDPKETTAWITKRCLVDWKTRRTGFYESDEIQLHMYKEAWEEIYPDLPIDAIFSWHPTDWRTAPDFKLKNQTDTKSKALLPHIHSMWDAMGKTEPSPSLVVSGQLTPDSDENDLFSFQAIKDTLEGAKDE